MTIMEMVYEKYPKTAAERTCLIEKRMMDALRASYKLKLENERKAEKGILDENGETQSRS
jgi:uncharacterized FlgJ-related protein